LRTAIAAERLDTSIDAGGDEAEGEVSGDGAAVVAVVLLSGPGKRAVRNVRSVDNRSVGCDSGVTM